MIQEEILKIEVRKHRRQIDILRGEVNDAKKAIFENLELAKQNSDYDARCYGLIHELSDRVCRHLHTIEEISKLIISKIKLITNIQNQDK